MILRLAVLAGLVLAPLHALAEEDRIIHPDKPDAVITTSEDIDDHEGAYEDIHKHEGGYEDIHDHEGGYGDIHKHEGRTEQLDDHHATSEQMDDRTVESERLHGMGALPKTTKERLNAARDKLRAARERHAHHEKRARQQAPASPAVDPELPAASRAAEAQYEHWTSRIDVARQRIGVAQAALDVWDESHARMIQSDYPRGHARQKLIDSRARAQERLTSEEAQLPRLIEEARRAGVPPGVLEQHVPEGTL